MNIDELRWAAGFFDGEGKTALCRHLNRKNKRLYQTVQVEIAQAHPFVLRRFRNAVSIGTVTGPFAPKNSKSKPYWRFAVNGFEKPQAIVGFLWRFLSPVKRRQARVALRAMRKYNQRPKLKPGPKRQKCVQ